LFVIIIIYRPPF